jgi:hypothetical protein
MDDPAPGGRERTSEQVPLPKGLLMAATDVTRARTGDSTRPNPVRRLTTETKSAIKTTEFYSYVVVLVGILLAGLLTSAGDGHDDRFQSRQVWLYATILTVGYMVSRGLAKSGSRDPYTDDGDNR